MLAINRKIVRTSLCLIVALLVAAYFVGPVIGITCLFSLHKQGGVAVWFESILFMSCALLLGLTALHLKNKGKMSYWRWSAFAAVLLYLSVNSATGVNKKPVDKFTDRAWWFDGSFVEFGLFIFLAIILLLVLKPVLEDMPGNLRWQFFISGLVFALGAIVVDDLDDLLFRGNNTWLYVLEEVLEFFGEILLLDAILSFIGAQIGPISLNFSPHQEQLDKD